MHGRQECWIRGFMNDCGVGHGWLGVVFFFAGLAFIRLDLGELVDARGQERKRITEPPEHWTTETRTMGPPDNRTTGL